MKWCQIFFFITLLNSLIFAKNHENAEDSMTKRWKVLSSPEKTKIVNYFDKEKKSRIIEFKGEGTKSAFKLDAKNIKKGNKKVNYWLSWEMNYNEDFVIMVIVSTNRGKDYILYTPSTENSYKQYGLGLDAMDGKWHSFKRNLQEDLSYYDNRVVIKSICSFVIRGSGKLDNIKTTIRKISKQTITEKIKVPIEIQKVKISKISRDKSLKKDINIEKMIKIRKSNSLPHIEISGDNPLHLTLGEAYVEQGVIAKDKEDGEINVISTEDIDIYKSGEYLVMYMATDSQGNMAVDKRKVYVGDTYVKKDKKGKSSVVEKEDSQSLEFDTENENYEEPPSEDELPGTEAQRADLSEEDERKKEYWERELEKRENELRNRTR